MHFISKFSNIYKKNYFALNSAIQLFCASLRSLKQSYNNNLFSILATLKTVLYNAYTKLLHYPLCIKHKLVSGSGNLRFKSHYTIFPSLSSPVLCKSAIERKASMISDFLQGESLWTYHTSRSIEQENKEDLEN